METTLVGDERRGVASVACMQSIRTIGKAEALPSWQRQSGLTIRHPSQSQAEAAMRAREFTEAWRV
jgi:hypothetical protein